MNKYTIFHEEPRVSFGSFTFAWEQREFGELYARSSEKNDGTISIDKNITVATMQFKPDIKVTTKEYLKTYFTFNVGDIAFEGHQSKEFKFGRFVENDIGNGIVSHIFAVFRPITEYDLQFWKYAINNESLMQNILSRSTKASTMMHDLVTNDFLKEKFSVPSLEEQRKIGSFLNKLDNLITLHQRESEFLCSVNHTKINKNNAYFTNDWEQRKVTELGKIYIGLVTTMTKHYTKEGTLLIRNSDIKDGYFDFAESPICLDEKFAQENESRMHKIGDVITVHTGDVGTSAVITENEANSIGFATIVTRPNLEIISSDYLCAFLNTDIHKKWAVSISTGDGRTNYNLGDYCELVIPFPSKEEQLKIASYIKKLNNLITLHQREPPQKNLRRPNIC